LELIIITVKGKCKAMVFVACFSICSAGFVVAGGNSKFKEEKI
jgi:hypothetical protein